MPWVIWEATTVNDPPGLTLTGPVTRAVMMSTRSPALTSTGPETAPMMV